MINTSPNTYEIIDASGKKRSYRPEIPNYRDKNYFYTKIDTYTISLMGISQTLNKPHTKKFFEKKIPIYNAKVNMIEQRITYMMNLRGHWIPKALLETVLLKVAPTRKAIQKKKEELQLDSMF